MSNFVQRLTTRAHPSENNDKYYSWALASLCLFIGEDNSTIALENAYAILKKENWIPIEDFKCCTLNEARINEQKSDIVEAYYKAKTDGYYIIEFLDNWTGNKDSPPILFPKISELFVDNVIHNSGGQRITEICSIPQKELNADYLVDDYIIELKILDEEGIILDTRQDKLSDLFYINGVKNIFIDPSKLNRQQKSEFLNIMGSPIKNDIKKASKQIKNTRLLLGNEKLNAAIIIINSNYSSIAYSTFNECIEKFLKNDTDTIKDYLSVNFLVETDGFDSNFSYEISPEKCNSTLEKIKLEFQKSMEELMNNWASTGFSQDINLLAASANHSFERNGVFFTKTAIPFK